MAISQFFEAGMLVCFGCSWPVAIAKTLRVRKVHGKSVIFLFFILAGYLSGVAAKLMGTTDWVVTLYAFNALMVATDIVLYFRFREPPDRPGLDIELESPGAEVIRQGSKK